MALAGFSASSTRLRAAAHVTDRVLRRPIEDCRDVAADEVSQIVRQRPMKLLSGTRPARTQSDSRPTCSSGSPLAIITHRSTNAGLEPGGRGRRSRRVTDGACGERRRDIQCRAHPAGKDGTGAMLTIRTNCAGSRQQSRNSSRGNQRIAASLPVQQSDPSA